ncbi:GFA family protein [Mesorhizobium sp. NBSH29]|uniref:GFA family protein n=1 Tax=Mesorhizobium sp. NBSH29 TaxID=2654249 RepID=UPI0018968262|nr:GFA family protein [Mesorhizobium sp. NBSH29]QPC87655.1 GFA family protein [Mesorhizobium sp. NBSH29]
MKIDGSCHCGKITYEAEVDPAKVSICHCVDCQKFTGTAFRVTVPVSENDFHLLSGEPKIYVKTAESGNKRAQAFCGDCGSQFYATSVGDGSKVYGVRTGTARQRTQLVPKVQTWHEEALPWLPELACVETTFERQS